MSSTVQGFPAANLALERFVQLNPRFPRGPGIAFGILRIRVENLAGPTCAEPDQDRDLLIQGNGQKTSFDLFILLLDLSGKTNPVFFRQSDFRICHRTFQREFPVLNFQIRLHLPLRRKGSFPGKIGKEDSVTGILARGVAAENRRRAGKQRGAQEKRECSAFHFN